MTRAPSTKRLAKKVSETRLQDLATEQSNPRTLDLDQLPVATLLKRINREDRTVPIVVGAAIPQIAPLVEAATVRLRGGGRLIYIGAGTSGRLACVDASEMPPTYGVPHTLVQGLIAGGKKALTRSQEGAEDDTAAGIRDIAKVRVSPRDVVVGLSASGRAAYVREGLAEARRRGAITGCITCNANSALIPYADHPVVVATGPEVVAGSTRMKAGTAQKLVLNMLSTAVMVGLGRVRGNRMVHLQIKCRKLEDRATQLVMAETGVSEKRAHAALQKAGGSVQLALEQLQPKKA